MRKLKTADFMMGFALGATLGTSVALVLALAKDKENQQHLLNRGREWRTQSEEVAQRILAQLKKATIQGWARLYPIVVKVRIAGHPQGSSEAPSPSEEPVLSRRGGSE